MSERFVPAIGRSIDTQQQYLEHLEQKRKLGSTACDLCASVERQDRNGIYPQIGEKALILTNELFTIIDNDYPYVAYDGQRIETHHMLVPREHIDFDSLKHDRKLRHLLADAEDEALEASDHAYTTIMARTSTSRSSSIRAHAHEHLLVTGPSVITQHFSIPEGQNDIWFSDGSSAQAST